MEHFKNKIVVLCPYCTVMYKVTADLKGKKVTCTTCRKNFIVDDSATDFYEMSLNKSLLFCKIALNYGFATEVQVESVLTDYTLQSQTGLPPSIDELFFQRRVLDEQTISKIKKIIPLWGLRQTEKKYAAEAVANGILTKERAKELLVQQAKHFDETGTVKSIKEYISEFSDLTVQEGNRLAEVVSFNKKPDRDAEVVKTEPDGRRSSELKTDVEKITEQSVSNIQAAESEIIQAQSITEKQDALVSKEPVKPKQEDTLESVDSESPPEREKNEAAVESETKAEGEKPVGPDDGVGKEVPLPPADIAAVEDEFKRAAGTVNEDEGVEFSVKNINGLELSLHPEGLIALLKAPDGIPPRTTPDSIKQMLEEEGIYQGIVDDSLIRGFLNSKVFREKPFKIAEGKPGKKGREGFIKFHFDIEHLKVGAVSESGEIDFKDRGDIPYVKKGDLLAEITPAVIGENGVDIYAKVIGVPVIHPVGLRCEEGTDFSEDRLKVYAKCDGQPKLTIGNAIYVLSELKIPGDVGFETGHIEFEGNVNILGTVQSDFRVIGANITANEVLGAELIATGDVTVHTGITGAIIKAEGDVKSKFVNRARIKTFGNVVIEKEIIDSEIINSGKCHVKQGKIISSEIYSRQGIEAGDIGTQMSKPSKLRIGVDDHINAEIEIVEKKISEKQEAIDGMKKEIEDLSQEEKKTHAVIAELAHVQDRSQIEVNELQVKLKIFQEAENEKGVAAATQKIEELTEAIKKADTEVGEQFDQQDELVETIAKTKDAVASVEEELFLVKQEKKGLTDWIKEQKMVASVKTNGTIFSGTTIIGPRSSMVIKENVKHAKIREVASPETDSGWEMKIT